jgi:hypothetical protein
MTSRKKQNEGGRRLSPREGKYIDLRAGISAVPWFIGDTNVQEQMLKVHTSAEYFPRVQMAGLVNLAAGIALMEKMARMTLTRGQAVNLFKERDIVKAKRFTENKQDAAIRFLSGSGRKGTIHYTRPMAFERKQGNPMSPSRPGSSTGKISTSSKGIIQTDKNFNAFLAGLQTIFDLDTRYGKKKASAVSVVRTMTEKIDYK